MLTAEAAECVLRGLALGCEGLDGVLGRYVGHGVVRATHAGEAVPAALDGLVQALIIGGAEEVAMSLDRHLLVALKIDGRRHLGRERLRQKRHSNGPPCEARAYNRTRQRSPYEATRKPPNLRTVEPGCKVLDKRVKFAHFAVAALILLMPRFALAASEAAAQAGVWLTAG